MNPNSFTKNTQNALSMAQNEAIRKNHQAVDVEHLLLALVQDPEGLIPKILKKLKIKANDYTAAIQEEIAKLPSVSGPGARPNEVMILLS